jgi:ABC-type multidrug transport system ATPase subunit
MHSLLRRGLALSHAPSCVLETAGRVAAGTVCGVLGPSGSGKSTLLALLASSAADVPATAAVAGRLRLGRESRPPALRKLTAYVAQADVLPPYLTVAECVQVLLWVPGRAATQPLLPCP